MAYKSILLHIGDGEQCLPRVDLALDLAARFGAHLTALATVQPLYLPSTARAAMGPDIEIRHLDLARERAQAALAAFTQRAARAGVASAETRCATGEAAEQIALHARYHDLAVIGQYDSRREDDRASGWRGFQDRLVLGLGRPVLLVPYAGTFGRIGGKVVLAWDAGREAARAAADALPLLQGASEVTVMIIDAHKSAHRHGAEPGADIALFLSRHGVRVNVMRESAGSMHTGEYLLSRIADLDADLLVMGAYGHSRLREMIAGGVTHALLGSMTVPVLMSH